MKNFRILLLVIGLLVSPAAPAGMQGGGGMVIDVTTNKPIADAKVRLECRKNLLHGSQLVKNIVVTTDAHGKFIYEPHQISECDFGYVYAEKPGYVETKTVDIRYSSTDYKSIPKSVYMNPEASVRLQHLQFLSALAGGGSPSKPYEYEHIYRLFYASKSIAETNPEKQYVHEQYCRCLLALYDGLSSTQRDGIKQKSISYSWKNRIFSGKIDHHQEVTSFCQPR